MILTIFDYSRSLLHVPLIVYAIIESTVISCLVSGLLHHQAVAWLFTLLSWYLLLTVYPHFFLCFAASDLLGKQVTKFVRSLCFIRVPKLWVNA